MTDYVMFLEMQRAAFAAEAMILPVWIIAISLGVLAAAVAGFLAWSAWQAMGSRWGWWRHRKTKDPGWIGNRGD